MNRSQVQLTDEQTAALRKLAAERGVSISELVRQGVDLLLRSAGPTVSREELVRRGLAASGRFRSDVTDLATRHDDYFAEAVEE